MRKAVANDGDLQVCQVRERLQVRARGGGGAGVGGRVADEVACGVAVAAVHQFGPEAGIVRVHQAEHVAQFVRWRPDREPATCGYAQLDQPVRYDIADVLTGRVG